MNTLPRTDYHEVFESLYGFGGVEDQGADLGALENSENSLLADEIYRYFSDALDNQVLGASEPEMATIPKENSVADENNDHLAWSGLGHIKDFSNEHYAWKDLGHIKENRSAAELKDEIRVQEADAALVRQVDTLIVAKGLDKALQRKAEELRKDNDFSFRKPRVTKKENQPEDDFDAWKGVLSAQDRNRRDEGDFWAEEKAAVAKRERAKRIGQRVVAAAAAVIFAVPAVNNYLNNRMNVPTKNTARAVVVNAGGSIGVPQIEFSTTTSTVVVEQGVATVSPASEAPAISLAEIAAQAKAKADAEDARIAEEKAAAAAAEAARQKSFEEVLEHICGSSNVVSEFGNRVHPIYGDVRLHAGIDVDCDYGDEIRPVKDGRVIFSGWMGGYGNTVIVDHGIDKDGNHLTTLYAHASSIKVETGQEVKEGTVIAEVGSSGDSTGPHSHTETRLNGSPVNPRQVLGQQ